MNMVMWVVISFFLLTARIDCLSEKGREIVVRFHNALRYRISAFISPGVVANRAAFWRERLCLF